LATAAARARAVGRPDAAKDLADLVERTGREPGADPLLARPAAPRAMPQGVPA
jgi:UDP-N-acetylglucosamine--N-acetylmuramyl-(pentapeptide) pyrophosphoryl-undecaprenol N-acetylglucosamine transferase